MKTNFGLKIVWPDWSERENFNKVIGFNIKKEKIAFEFKPGDKMLVYATSPIMRIIATIEVTKSSEECLKEGIKATESHEIPIGIRLLSGPFFPGITLEAAGINIRIHKGLTYIPISEKDFNNASRILQETHEWHK